MILNHVEWIFSGIGTSLANRLFFLSRNRNKKFKLPAAADVNINREVNGITQESILYCVTFRKNTLSPNPVGYPWINHKKIKVETMDGRFILPKQSIYDHLERPSDPYKFYLLVKREEKENFWVNLLDAHFTVTGVGQPDDNFDTYWRIWFLVDKEPIHCDVNPSTPKYINHCLFS